jgi:hypothetical protein
MTRKTKATLERQLARTGKRAARLYREVTKLRGFEASHGRLLLSAMNKIARLEGWGAP